MAENLTPKKPDKNAPKVAEPRHGLRKIKTFVDTQPTMYNIKESVDERLAQLVRFGLGDPAKLAFYNRALSDPRGSVQSAVYREYVAEALSRLLAIILADPSLFIRVRTLLQSRLRGGRLTLEDVALAAMQQVLEGKPAETTDADEDLRKKTVHKRHPRPTKDADA